MSLAERMRQEMEQEQRAFNEQAQRAAEQQAQARADRVERMRKALSSLDDDLVETLARGGSAGSDLLAEALVPIQAERGERRSAVSALKFAQERLPTVEAEIKELERQLKLVDKDASADDWTKGRGRPNSDSSWPISARSGSCTWTTSSEPSGSAEDLRAPAAGWGD